MGDRNMAKFNLMAVSVLVVCFLFVSSINSTSPVHFPGQKRSVEGEAPLKQSSRFIARFNSLVLKKSALDGQSASDDWQPYASLKSVFQNSKQDDFDKKSRFRREEDDAPISRPDEDRLEYEKRLFIGLKIVGSVPATRLYVPEDPKLFPVGTVVGKVQKLHPYGKVKVVWPYQGFRNFTVDENTGEVKTTALMDFELIRSYNMTIRDFQYNYSDAEPRKQPPKPVPENSAYIDHYLIVEVVDLNDNFPKFEKDTGTGGIFYGRVNQNARAGTPILRVHAIDDDSGPRGRIRFDIQIDGVEENPFTIDPETHMLKTNGKSLKTQIYKVKVVAYDYGMPPKSSGVQIVSVDVGKTPPEFIGVSGVSYNLNFSEASVRGSNVANVTAVSKSGIPMTYEILEKEAMKTFAINDLGQITLLRELDFENANETDKVFEFTVRGKENAVEGQVKNVRVNLNLVNADDHLGMFKTPATKIRLKEGSALKGDVFSVEVEDCDCQKNCLCGSNEMIFTLGDTNGFFDITKDGQIQNIKNLDYEAQSYFFFPVKVTDPGTGGRTRTSYIEVYVEDDDDTPPKFPVHSYEFFIFEDAPKGQVVGVAQAVDPDPSTQPDDVQYSIISATPNSARVYFAVGNQGVIKVNENKDQFGKQDNYELVIEATDKLKSVSDPPATVIIRVLDVNDNQPVFTKCESQTIKENQRIGTVLTTLTATDKDRGFNKLIEYSIQNVQKHNFFEIDNKTGVVTTTHVLDREKYDNIFVVAKATDGGPTRSDALRQIGYCQFIVNVEDVNDHHPEFTVAKFDVTIKRTLGTTKEVLLVEAEDPDVGDNAKIKYKIKSQTKNRVQTVDYFTVHSTTGSLKVKNSLTSLSLLDKISVVIQAYNDVKVVGPLAIADAKSETTVIVSFTNKEPLKFEKTKYIVNGVKESIGAGKSVLTLNVIGSRKALYSLQTEIRDRDNIPFTLDAGSGNIGTSKTLNYEVKKSYVFAVTAAPLGEDVLSSAIVEINIQDIDDVVPIFGNDKYQATVSEAAKANVNVFRIKATDPDPSSGGPMVYVVRPLHDHKTFQVIKVKDYAQIKTAKNLRDGFFDREKKDVYTIIVDAYREKAPGLKGTAYVNIHVRDENDSPPVFQKKLYKASVPEDTVSNYTVPGLVLMATDKDILENADISYFITSGNDGRFEMRTIYGRDGNNTGELVVVRPLDVEKTTEFQKNPVYNLTVTATDRKHTDTTTITITVLDRPETRPEFIEDYYEKYLPENVGPGVNVVQVGVKKQLNVEFSLDDKAKPYFAINRFNGWITTAGELLDWEKTPVITFPVYAFEKNYPEEKGQTFVRVIVNDVNDAPPYFPDQPYIGYIRENVRAGATVRYVNGKDLDDPDVNSGNNVKLTYELLTNTGQDPYDKDGQLFTFNSQGLLVTKVKFDLEKYRRNLTVRVRAWDNGNPKLYGETDVTIVILDVNERAAVFRKREYEASVSETQPPGFVVLQLTVIDYDFAPQGNYAFYMIKGNKPYAFDISQDTGEIVVAGVLGYDKDDNKENTYELEIGLNERNGEFEVHGSGVNITVAHLDFAKVVITVTAGNDNRPTFGNAGKIYKVTVPEDIKVGTALNVAPVIEATDADKGFSNQFDFRITKGNRGDWFGIRKDSKDANKAVVFMVYPIDREYKSVYEMELIVRDYGGVSDMAKLIVTVTDVNDNAPVFHPSNYKATIKENDCTDNKPLVTLSVTDPDLPEKQKFKLEFAPNGNPGDRFRLTTTTDNTTALTCQKSINREETPNVKVIIKATDEGTPRLSSTAIVFIEVEDVDEVSPKSAKMRIIVNAVNGDFDGGPVGKAYFEDNDGDGDRNMVYTLTGSEEFAIKRSNGWISAKSTVKVGIYELRVTGRKGSGSLVSCDVDVDVRNLPKEVIQHSAAIQLKDVWNENRFLNPVRIDNSAGYEDLTYYDKFVDMLSDMFDVVKDNVFVFNIQMATKVMPGRQMPAVDVRFAIRKDSSVKSKFLPRYVLINTLERNNKTLKELGFKLGMIGIDYCVNESMRVGMCNNVVERKGKSYSVVSSDYGLMPAPKYAVAVVSIDTTVNGVYSRYKENPDPEYDTCDPEPCLNGGTCHEVLPHGFVCECPGEYSGPRCQLTTRTFLGDSYIWLRPKTPYNYGSISLEFATGAANGLLLYQGPAVKGGNNGRGDFLAISLVNGRIKVGLSFGGKPLVFTLEKSARLDNRKWHHVEVSHQRKDVTVIIDHCKYADIVEDDERIVERRENCEIITKTTQNYEYLNGLGPIQIGGVENMPLDYPSSKFVLYTYFSGCIRKIRDTLEMYDLGYPLKVVNAPVGCTVMAKCPTCLNGGYCFPGYSRSTCTCPMGFVGDDCSGNAPRYFYLPNSYTKYVLPGEERRRKRGAAQEASDLLDRYTVHISMQIRLNQGVKKATFFYASSEDNMEYSLLAFEEQKLYFEFKLLDALTRLEMPGTVEIDDSNWHNITATREGNFAVLQVDYTGRVSRNTGGAKQLIRMGSGKLYAGGVPSIAPNTTIVNKVVEAAVTDIRHRKRRSAGTIIGVTTEGEAVSSVAGDMTGCTGGSSYNGKNLDTDPNVKKVRFRVEIGCPCQDILQCRNGGVCVSASVAYCQCTAGWSGITCEQIVVVPPVLGNRVDGRARWRDGGVLIVILCVVFCVLILAIALLFVKKRREAPFSVPVGDEGQDSIMPYHDEGAGEEDTFNYDIHHLMKYSYRDGHGTVTKSTNGKDIAPEHMELLSHAPGAMEMSHMGKKEAMMRESVDIWPFIQERVDKADDDTSWWAGDEMRHWDDEGDDEEAADLSEIGESDDEGGDAEQDWDFLKDLGRKFDNLNKIFNPDDDDDDDDDDEETEA